MTDAARAVRGGDCFHCGRPNAPPSVDTTTVMKTSIRSLLAASTIAIVLAACTTATSTPPSSDPSPTSPPPSVAPSEAPEETPAANPTVVGTLTMIGAAVDGPGEPLADALARDLTEPVFARGVLFLDTDGQLYFADSIVDAAAPTFGDLRVRVANYPTDGPRGIWPAPISPASRRPTASASTPTRSSTAPSASRPIRLTGHALCPAVGAHGSGGISPPVGGVRVGDRIG